MNILLKLKHSKQFVDVWGGRLDKNLQEKVNHYTNFHKAKITIFVIHNVKNEKGKVQQYATIFVSKDAFGR